MQKIKATRAIVALKYHKEKNSYEILHSVSFVNTVTSTNILTKEGETPLFIFKLYLFF